MLPKMLLAPESRLLQRYCLQTNADKCIKRHECWLEAVTDKCKHKMPHPTCTGELCCCDYYFISV